MHLTQFLKHLVGTAAMPLACGLIIAVAGAVARLLGWRWTPTVLWTAAACIVYLAATAPMANALLGPLESRYPPLRDVSQLPPVGYIVVLGGNYAPHDGIPVTAALEGDGLARIAEGIILMRRVHGAHLVVSGGASAGEAASADGYARLAVDLGVEEGMIVKLDKPRDTQEEASSVAALVGNSPFLLVTSAYHMPRAVRLMRLAGANPIPAPTGQLARHIDLGAGGWIPRSESLRKTECALHEYLGLALAN